MKPHVVLITMDELHRGALSRYAQKAIQTPNLDRLAAQSLDFRRAYTASPLCLPSRTTLATGLWPHNHGAVSNHPPSALHPARPNLYTSLRSVGYTTAHVGKCHYLPVPYGETRSMTWRLTRTSSATRPATRHTPKRWPICVAQ